MAAIDIRGVRKRYGDQEVIRGIDLHIEDAELIVVVGPSGCGKSTLLRMIAGLETISEGEIAIGGRVVNDLEPMNRDIAMVFQNYALYPHMSVYDNMAYGLRNRRYPRAEIDERVRRAAGVLHIEAYLDRRPRQLSGGQRQRVAMGRAIVRDPAAFLFDEPLSNLDAKLRVQMRLEIKKLQGDLRTTSVYVTHDQVEAMTLADRLVVMNHGVAEQIGTPMEVYTRPATLFVGGFIGSPSMSFMRASVDGDSRTVTLGSGRSLALTGTLESEAGREVIVGIRPEHLLTEGGAGDDPLDVRVELVEPLGADTLVHGVLGGQARNEAGMESHGMTDGTEVTARLPGDAAVRRGETLRMWVPAARLHVFDAASGQRLGVT